MLLADVQSVGVMGDGRTYENPVIIRAVTSEDAMTADWARLPPTSLDRIALTDRARGPGVNRVAYDVTSKPPARSSGSEVSASPPSRRVPVTEAARGCPATSIVMSKGTRCPRVLIDIEGDVTKVATPSGPAPSARSPP